MLRRHTKNKKGIILAQFTFIHKTNKREIEKDERKKNRGKEKKQKVQLVKDR